MEFRNLVEIIEKRKSCHNKGITFIYGDKKEKFISYNDLYINARAILHSLQDMGVKTGDELIFQIDNNFDFICNFWACLLGKIIPVPVTVGNNDENKLKLFNIWKILKNPYLIKSEKNMERLEVFADNRRLDKDITEMKRKVIFLEDIRKNKGRGKVFLPDESDIAYIQFSSGSTGDPKGVVLTHKNLITNINAIISGLKSPSRGERFFSWMPLTHDMGIIGFHLTPLVANWNQFLMPTELFIRYPGLWLKKTSEHKISLTVSPNFGYKYVLKYAKREKYSKLDLSSLRLIVNGAEPISAELCDEFLEKMAPFGLKRNTMFPVYGLAEASLAVSFSEPEDEIVVANLDRNNINLGEKVKDKENCLKTVSFVGVGSPIKDCFVRVVDDHGNILEDKVIGHIQIKGDNVTSGYYNNKEVTSETITSDSWLQTGDLGFFKKGKLFITGRSKDIIFVNGQNYYPHDIERVAEEVEEIEMGRIAVAGYSSEKSKRDEIIVFIVFRNNTEKFIPLYLKLRNHINKKMGLEIENIIPVVRIPKTTSGKVQRYKLVKMFQDGQFNGVIQDIKNTLFVKSAVKKKELPVSSIEEKLLKIWKEVLDINEIGVTDNFFEMGGNSLKATMMIGRIAAEFNVNLHIEQIFNNQTIKNIAAEMDQAEKQTYQKIEPVKIKNNYPLLPSQKRLFVLYKVNELNTAYNLFQFILIEGNLNRRKIEDIFKMLVSRHDSLRTSFNMVSGEPVQKVHKDVDFNIQYFNISNQYSKGISKQLYSPQSEISRNFMGPFDFCKAPLLKVGLIKLEEKKYLLMLNAHHIIADGTSIVVLINEFIDILKGKSLADIDINYKDYVLWYHKQKNSQRIHKQKKYWQKEFSGDLPVLNLPSDYPRPSIHGFEGNTLNFEINHSIAEELKTLALSEEVSLYMVLIAMFYILLSKLSAQEDIVIGTPVAGRNHKGVEKVVGMFVNTLAIRNYPTNEKSFREFLKEVRNRTLKAFENQDYPFEELLGQLDVKSDMSHNPLFDVMFVMQNMDIPDFSVSGLKLKLYPYKNTTSKFDLTLFAVEAKDKLSFQIEYCTKLFKKRSIKKFINYFKNIVYCVLNNPDQKILEIEILSRKEREKLLFKLNDTETEYPNDQTIHELFEAQVAKAPDRTALICRRNGGIESWPNYSISYRALDEKANQLARILRRRGIKPNQIVGIMIERSFEAIIGIMGILKAGGAYLPIDSEYPEERINYLLRESGTKVLITNMNLKPKIKFKGVLIILENKRPYRGNKFNVENINTSRDLAYVLYTSGSTGKPKGVMVQHQSVVNYIWWAAKKYVKSEKVSFPLYTSLSFDLTVTSIFTPLITGNSIIIYNTEAQELLIEDVIRDNQCGAIKLTPAHLKVIKNMGITSNIKCFIIGGENLEVMLARDIYQRFGNKVEIFNEYGPTEATVGCMIYKYNLKKDQRKSVPIGLPADNTQIHILDKNKKPVPVGVNGEMFISGDGLSRGYLNNPELTSEKFTLNPFIPNKNLYITGDLGRRFVDGNIEYLGREDSQVKIRGYRVELSEIENHLLKNENINEAVVLEKEDKNSERHLLAYIVTKKEIKVSELREYLSKELPHYLIPSHFIKTDKIPLTSNGKVDRKALAKIDKIIDTREKFHPPRDKIEEIMKEEWEDVLCVKKVSIYDNFFELGGDSIKAVQIASRMNDSGVSINARDILNHQTIAQLSLNVDFFATEKRYDQGIIEGKKELTPIDRWFFENDFNNPGYYTQSVLLHLKQKVDILLLEKAFDILIKYHDGLRLNYNKKKKCLYFNNNHLNHPFHLEIFNLLHLSKEEKKREVEEIGSFIKGSFDLADGLLTKAGLIEFDNSTEKLLIIAHHLVIDGVSWRILLKDLFMMYKALEKGEQRNLPQKTASLKDWYDKLLEYYDLKELEKEKEYWHEIEHTRFVLPVDYQTEDWRVSNLKKVIGYLEEKETELLLKKVHKAYNTDVFILLMVALSRTLKEWIGNSTFIVEMENHGRHIDNVDVSRTVGWFTSMYPIKINLKGNGIGEQIMEVKEQIRKVPNNGLGYGLLKYIKGNLTTAKRRRSEIRFNYLGQFDTEINNELFLYCGSFTGSDVAVTNHMTANIEINSMIVNRHFKLEIYFNKKVYKEDTIIYFKDHYIQNLKSILKHLKNEEDIYFTPSDFETIDLEQEELDALFN